MSEHNETKKSCGPQLSEGLPAKNWGVDQLGGYASSQLQAIETSERSVTVHYWRLGLALNLSRPQFSRGQWGEFLKKLNIDKTRASKARAIHCTFETEESVTELSVQEAYERREKNPRKPAFEKGRRKESSEGMLPWLLTICQKADSFLDEAAFTTPNQATVLLTAIDSVIEELTTLRDRVGQNSSKSTDPPLGQPKKTTAAT